MVKGFPTQDRQIPCGHIAHGQGGCWGNGGSSLVGDGDRILQQTTRGHLSNIVILVHIQINLRRHHILTINLDHPRRTLQTAIRNHKLNSGLGREIIICPEEQITELINGESSIGVRNGSGVRICGVANEEGATGG